MRSNWPTFYLDDEVVAAHGDRLAYLLHSWPLPGDAGASAAFDPGRAVTVATPAGRGDATTYAVFLTHYDGTTLARLAPLAFPGVDLLGLAGHLRTADPATTGRRSCSCCGRSSRRTKPPSSRRCAGATTGRASTSTTPRGRGHARRARRRAP
jgi:hypothetical protein